MPSEGVLIPVVPTGPLQLPLPLPEAPPDGK